MTSKITVGAANHMLITIALLNPEARHDVVLNTYDYFRNLPEIKLPPNRDQYLTDLDIRKLEWAVTCTGYHKCHAFIEGGIKEISTEWV